MVPTHIKDPFYAIFRPKPLTSDYSKILADITDVLGMLLCRHTARLLACISQNDRSVPVSSSRGLVAYVMDRALKPMLQN
jgi:hypothetical protein